MMEISNQKLSSVGYSRTQGKFLPEEVQLRELLVVVYRTS